MWKYAVDIPARREVSGPGGEIIVVAGHGLRSGGFSVRCLLLAYRVGHVLAAGCPFWVNKSRLRWWKEMFAALSRKVFARCAFLMPVVVCFWIVFVGVLFLFSGVIICWL